MIETGYTKTDTIISAFEKRLTDTFRKESVFKLLKGLLYTVLLFVITGFIIVILESVFGFRAKVRTILYWAFLLAFLTTITCLSIIFLLDITAKIRKLDFIRYSMKVGGYFANIKDSISNSLSLSNSLLHKKSTVFSEELILANLEKTAEISKDTDLSGFIKYNRLKKTLYALFSTMAVILICFMIFSGPLKASVNRLINYRYEFINNEYGITFDVYPGNIETFRGNSINVRVKINQNKPGLTIDEIDIYAKQKMNDGTENIVYDKTLKNLADGSFQTTIENISTSLIYYTEYKGIKSEAYKITIAEYPMVKSFSIQVNPPGYTGMPSVQLKENEGDVFCAEGSKLYIKLKASKELATASVIFNGKIFGFKVIGDEAEGEFTAVENGTYQFLLKDKAGQENKSPSVYNIKVLKDEPPKIVIIEPTENDYSLTGEKDIMIRARITDDFGFSKLTLGYRKVNKNVSASGVFALINIPIQNLTATALEVLYLWNLAGLKIRTGDVIEYYMEVTDNSGKSSRTDIRLLRYKSLAELLKESKKDISNLNTDLKSIMEQVHELQKELQKMRNDSKNAEELGLNDPKKRQELQDKMQNLQDNMNSTQKKIDQGVNELQQKNLLSQKTLEQFMKMQELFNKINTPEFREMLKKLQEALKKNNPDMFKQELKNFNFDEEAFKKQLEKVMEIMKKIENLQKMGDLTQKLDDITKQQEELKKQTEKADKNNEARLNTLADKQKDLQEKLQDYKDDLKKFTDELSKTQQNDINPEELSKLSKKLNEKKTTDKMGKSSKELFKGQKENSEKTQEDILNDLNELNDEMQDAMENAMSSQNLNDKMKDKMKQIKKDIEKLSEDQGDLKNETKDTKENNKGEFQKRKNEQKDLQNRLMKSIDDIMMMSREGMQISPELGKELGNSYNKMDKASEDLGKPDKSSATQNQQKAKDALDRAAKMLGDMLDQMSSQSKGKQKGPGRMGQLMQQLAQMIAQQQGVNSQTQKSGKNGNKGKDGKDGKDGEQSEDAMKETERLKIEQEAISKSMEELTKEFEKERERTGEKLLGDLKEIQKQMQEVVKDMQENRIDDKLIEKQNRIVSRMLDAQLSQREKDFEQKRESVPGENVTRMSPPEVVISGPKTYNALKEDVLKMMREGYSEDFEPAIARYLKKVLEIKR